MTITVSKIVTLAIIQPQKTNYPTYQPTVGDKCGKWSTAHCCNKMLQIIRQIIMINHKLKQRARACMCICLCVYARSRESTLMENSLKQIFVFILNNSRMNHSAKFAFENRIINKYEDLNHYITQQQTIFISISHTYTVCHKRSGT